MPRNSLDSIRFTPTATLKAMFSVSSLSRKQQPEPPKSEPLAPIASAIAPAAVSSLQENIDEGIYGPPPVRPRTRRASASTHEVITAHPSSTPSFDAIPEESPEPEFIEDAESVESDHSFDSEDESLPSKHSRDSGIYDLDNSYKGTPSPPRSPTIDELEAVETKEEDEARERRTALEAERLQFMISEEEARAFEDSFSQFLNRQMPAPPKGGRKLPPQRHKLSADDFCSYMKYVSCKKLERPRPMFEQVLISNLIDKVQHSEFCYWPLL
ncbi:hypothetical protein BDR26DRAFT_848699 [Obelidium mucronatum]|nr:hypothetical protein BDR26DRAFT_848699 [Obelidium mucronatum]